MRRSCLPTLGPALFALAACAVLGSALRPPPAMAEDEERVLAVETPIGAPELAAAIRGGWFFRWLLPRLRVRVDVGPTAEAAAGDDRIVAAPWPLPVELAPLVAALPLGEDAGVLRFDGTSYPAPEVALAVRLPAGPAGTEAAVSAPGWLVTGYRPEGIAEAVSQVLAWIAGGGRRGGERSDYQLRESPWLDRRGRWVKRGDRWRVDRESDRDGFADRERWFAALEPVDGGADSAAESLGRVILLVPRGEGGRQEYRRLAADLQRAVAEMAPRVPVPAAALAVPIRVAVERDFPAQVRHTGRIGEAVRGGPADLHLVFHPDDLFAYRHALAALLIERSGILPELPPWLARGAALWLSGGWFGRPWRDWLPILAAAGALPDADQLLVQREQGDGSAPLWTPAAAAVVDALRGETLAAKLPRAPGRPAVAALLARAERAARMAPAPASAGTAAEADGGAPGVAPTRPPFLRGVSLAMLNSLDGGYQAPAVDGQLDRLAALGADAVSLMPFAYQRDPHRPGLVFLNRSAESETDVGTIHAARRAHGRALRVLWKPQLWISGESWPGAVAMTSEADWATWWNDYRRLILHHALLAGWARAELFSVGVELSATLGREAEWRRLIADVRRFYPGTVTYSANWGDDLDRVGFWGALDLVGVDAYYPLSASPQATAEELSRGAREVVERLARVAAEAGKPLLLTEIGFAARRAAWVDPHREGGDVQAADQAAAYRALLGALGRPRWLAGVFVWKAFSAPVGEGGREPRADFRFLGRPAEEEVKSYFRAEFLPPNAG